MTTVSRGGGGREFFCRVHGSCVPDLLVVDDGQVRRGYCMACNITSEPRRTPVRPWYFTGSPHGREIMTAGLIELKPRGR